jgi:hypothetical protein
MRAATLSPSSAHGPRDVPQAAKPATLHSLIQAIAAPHDVRIDSDASKFSVTGCDMEISGPVISSLALLFHEFATNSTKHGALLAMAGRIQIRCANHGQNLVVTDRRSVEGSSGAGHCQRHAPAYPGGMTSNDNRSSGLCVAWIMCAATCV